MDFGATLKALVEAFEADGVRYALAGGVALAALGAERATRDIDFLVDRRDLPKADAAMTRLGFRVIYRSDEFTQYQHQAVGSGLVDFQHAFRSVSLGMLDRALTRRLGTQARQVRVLRPEDLIGLKVQAIANNPDRRKKDEADIEALMDVHRSGLDWSRLAEYYALFGMSAELEELRRRFDRAQ